MERKTVVVVEDESDISDLLCAILMEEGYRVVEAHNGKEGIDAVLAEKPDLVLSPMPVIAQPGGQSPSARKRRQPSSQAPPPCGASGVPR